jgi:hypothetical protein
VEVEVVLVIARRCVRHYEHPVLFAMSAAYVTAAVAAAAFARVRCGP